MMNFENVLNMLDFVPISFLVALCFDEHCNVHITAYNFLGEKLAFLLSYLSD